MGTANKGRRHSVHLTNEWSRVTLPPGGFTGMTSDTKERVERLLGTLDLIVLRALGTMGPQ